MLYAVHLINTIIYNWYLMNFAFWNVMIDIGFWTRLAKNKIEIYQLSDQPQPLVAKFRITNRPEKHSLLTIDAFSFGLSEEDKSGPIEFKIEGKFCNKNTVQDFNKVDAGQKQRQLMGKQIKNFQRYVKGQNVKHFHQIFLLIFADLKKHLFTYQFFSTAIPVRNYTVGEWGKFEEVYGQNEKGLLTKFIKSTALQEKVFPQFSVFNSKFQPATIKQFLQNKEEKFIFLVTDTSNYQNQTGYHTSTVLAFFAWLRQQKLVQDHRLKELTIVLLRDFVIYNKEGDYSFKNSRVLKVDASSIQIDQFQKRLTHKKQKQQIDLKSFMDELTLAKQAIDLNIKLMKWRLLPQLDIPKVQSAKCLLFGAGTLGCQLARNLIGWGIKNITFIDYSKVSYSNPVRQSLYDYQDTIKGGKPKAQTAAQKLKKIYPQIKAQGYSLQVPMPGHYVTTSDQVAQTFQNLNKVEQLVAEHDVLFLLLDSRQARWLPTVLANKYNKACITVGLGFDSFVVVRHGVPPQLYQPEKHGERLCCYFCNDIVTPQNTMKDRTLDQMCTVTKPGLSFVSSAYAAQMFVSLLHHPLGHHAPANEDSNKLQVTCIGKLPHHLRGSIGDYQTSIFYGRAFEQCVACSRYILDEYVNNREEFMLNVLNDPSFIHKVTKLQDELDNYAQMEGGIIEIMQEDLEFMKATEAKQNANSAKKQEAAPHV